MNRPRASACRNAPPAEWTSRSDGEGAATIEQVRHRAMGSAGAGGAAAAVGKRRRERDAELQIQTPRLTVRRYEKWGNEHPGPDDRGRSAANFPERGGAEGLCVREVVGRAGAAAAPTRGCRFFFIHIHPRLRRGAPRRGGKADRSVQRPVRLVRCVGHGGGARGVGAVRRHARGGARGTGRAGQRGKWCAGA